MEISSNTLAKFLEGHSFCDAGLEIEMRVGMARWYFPHFGCGHSCECVYIAEHMWRSKESLRYQSFLPSCLRQGLLMLLLLGSASFQGPLFHRWFCSRSAGIAGVYSLIQLPIGSGDWNHILLTWAHQVHYQRSSLPSFGSSHSRWTLHRLASQKQLQVVYLSHRTRLFWKTNALKIFYKSWNP